MHSFDKALQLQPVAGKSGFWTGTFVQEWDRGDGLAQGGYTNAYALKALLTAAPKYPHPVSLTVHFLDILHIGVPCEFHVTLQRTGKRYAYLALEIRQNGRLAITGLGVCASATADAFVDNGGGVKGDIGQPELSVAPKITKEECGEQPQDLFGRPKTEAEMKINEEIVRERGGMWQHMHRLMPKDDVAHIRAWRDWRAKKTALDGECEDDDEVARRVGPPPSPIDGSGIPSRGFVELPGRKYDALSCCLWVDNAPPFSMQAWRDPKMTRGNGEGFMPGWTTVQLTTEWTRACEADNGGVSISNGGY